MRHQHLPPSVRDSSHAGSVLPFALIIALVALCSSTFAQGTATGPFTSHDVEAGPIVYVGDVISPMPIDLDPTGSPWFKSINDPMDFVPSGLNILDIVETIENVGTEAWGDWHEELLAPPAGLIPATWSSVVSLSVNGSLISFTPTGLGSQILTLDGFSQPVLPGDIFEIHKQVLVDGSPDATASDPLIRMQEYPTPVTPVPEPASFALAMLGLSFLVVKPRLRSSRSM